MFTVTKTYRTETGHRLMDYDGKCSHLHGHSYVWKVTVGCSGLDARDMVVDFGDLKDIMDQVIGPFDHALVLRGDDPFLDNIPRATNGDKQRLIVMADNPTAEAMARLVGVEIARELNVRLNRTDLTVTRVEVSETHSSAAECCGGTFWDGAP